SPATWFQANHLNAESILDAEPPTLTPQRGHDAVRVDQPVGRTERAAAKPGWRDIRGGGESSSRREPPRLNAQRVLQPQILAQHRFARLSSGEEEITHLFEANHTAGSFIEVTQRADCESRELDVDGGAPLCSDASIGPAGGSHAGSLEAINDQHTLRASSPQ